MQMEDGYNTAVNERGSRLSAGQRQLISFARALLADPKILILDEATSSIDTETELLLQKGLAELLKGRTSFIIAHRLSTIKNADCIMYVDDGVMNAYVHYLLVRPEYQDRKIGRELVEMIKKKYADYLRVIVIAYNTELKFYERCGFEKSDVSSPMFITSLWT